MSSWVGNVGSVRLTGPVVTLPNLLAALLIGLAVTLAAALEPARRAGGVPPVEALKARLDPQTARRARLRWLVVVFALVGVIGLFTWPRAAGEAALARSLLVYGVLLVVTLAVPLSLPLLARVGGAPFVLPARLEERLARASLLRDRSRAALTVSALTVGIAMIVALGGVGQHARASAGAWIADVVPGELVMTSIFPRAADEGITEALDDLSGVASASPFATFDVATTGLAWTALRWSGRTSRVTADCGSWPATAWRPSRPSMPAVRSSCQRPSPRGRACPWTRRSWRRPRTGRPFRFGSRESPNGPCRVAPARR